MRVSVQIENIDELRRCNGIDDIELHGKIDRLRVGDHVLLTFLSGSNRCATLSVRITRIRAGRFRGHLAARPARPALLGLRDNAMVAFTAGQIHSITRPQPKCAQQEQARILRRFGLAESTSSLVTFRLERIIALNQAHPRDIVLEVREGSCGVGYNAPCKMAG